MPEIFLKQTGKESYRAETPRGLVQFGGESPGPMTTVAASLAGCFAMSVTDALETMRQKPSDLEIRLSFERNKEEPNTFESFNMHLTFRGEGLSPAKLEKAIRICEESYCPVSVILRRSGAQIKTTYVIEEKKIAA
jgi:putative redox protein